MTHTFDADVVSAVLRHMNGDHTADNLLIVSAFTGIPADELADVSMTGFDGDGGVWAYTRADTASELRVDWPGGPIDDRASVRREVVAVYDLARERLGL
ncbi:DUF2470 domain-containing protein [Microbacterium sp.]|uniref:DUF2470 domain-containing protein n=1 Tax=Microbacterium sp. TaxID=51671 RepID=UPI0039E2B400